MQIADTKTHGSFIEHHIKIFIGALREILEATIILEGKKFQYYRDNIVLIDLAHHMPPICSDEGLMLKPSAFQSLYSGQFTLSTQLIKLN